LAFSRKSKEKIVKQYGEWIDNSKAIFIVKYAKMAMSPVDEARRRMREVDAEFHVVKNRLFELALEEKGYPYDKKFWEGNNIVAFAFENAPDVAKVLTEISKGNEIFELRAGYLGAKSIDAVNIRTLADLPTLPVMRAMLMGTILAPASKLVRTLAEPARGLAAVIKAQSEKQATAG